MKTNAPSNGGKMIEMPKSAMVLAAGLGSRMQPLTDHTPKPLLEIGGRSFLNRIIDALKVVDVKNIIVNVHYLADQIVDHIKHCPHVTLSDERDVKLETGGGVRRALPLLGSTPFFTLNADAIWLDRDTPMLQRMAEFFDDSTMDALLLLQPIENVTGSRNAGDAFLDADNRINFRGDVTIAPYMFAGVTLTHPRLYNDAPDDAFSQKLLWDRAAADRRLFGLVHDGAWFHASTPDDLDVVNKAWPE